MMIQSFLIVLPSLLAGFLLVHFFWRKNELSALGLKASLGIGLGLGLNSCLYFLRMLLFPGQDGYVLIQVLLLAAVAVLLILQRKNRQAFTLRATRFHWSTVLFAAATLLVIVLTLDVLVTRARSVPHGDYDAQAIWNLRARFIYRLEDSWRDSFSPLINRNFHMDYPLLIPLSVVGGWNALGGEVLRVPSVVAILFLMGMAGVLYFSISHWHSSAQAAIATILLLATPRLVTISTFQTADMPLMYFFLSAASLLVLGSRENNRGLFFLAGMTAGLAAWTKNEGIPFLLVVPICLLLIFGIQQARGRALTFLAGTAFPLLTVALFKVFVAASNDLFSGNGMGAMLTKLFTPARYVQIVGSLLSELWQLGGWPISIILILLIYGWVLGRSIANDPAEKVFWLLPAFQFMAYMLVYLITPHDLQWHTKYSMERLLLHLFPMGLTAFFLFVKPPEVLLGKVK